MKLWLIVVFSVLLFPNIALPAAARDPLVVSSSFSIIYDLVQEVGGDRIDHRLVVPVGAEVHEWELVPRNFVDLEETNVFFYNGLSLEEWLPQAEAVLDPNSTRTALGERADVGYLRIKIGEQQGDIDPHVWMNPSNVVAYVAIIAEVLAAADPDNEGFYRSNAERLQAELVTLDEDLRAALAVIPDEQRVLITSEAAFLYFAEAYGFVHDGIWGTNAEEEGTPQQIVRILGVIAQYEPAAIFWESTISDRYVQTVAADTGLAVKGPLFVDSLSGPEGPASSYLHVMRHNANVIVEGLRP